MERLTAYSHSVQKRDSQTWFPHQEIGIVERSDSWDHADVCACPITNKAQDSQFLAEVWGTSAKGKRGSCIVVAMKHRLSDRTRTLSSHRRWMIQVNLVISMDCSAEQKKAVTNLRHAKGQTLENSEGRPKLRLQLLAAIQLEGSQPHVALQVPR